VIDWDRVAELRDEVGLQAFGEVVELYFLEVEEVLGRLRDAPRRSALESDLHFVKSSAITLGFSRLGQICQSGERMAARAEFDGIDIAAVLAAYDASKAEFLARLG
jgi:HPt (histidine-containing phosphotransfer) domain-containing protein